jgi:hypothetical protein
VARPRDDRQKDLLRPALEEIIDLGHPLVRLAGEIDWEFLDRRFASVCAPGPGQPGLPTRLVAGLFILKHMHNAKLREKPHNYTFWKAWDFITPIYDKCASSEGFDDEAGDPADQQRQHPLN